MAFMCLSTLCLNAMFFLAARAKKSPRAAGRRASGVSVYSVTSRRRSQRSASAPLNCTRTLVRPEIGFLSRISAGNGAGPEAAQLATIRSYVRTLCAALFASESAVSAREVVEPAARRRELSARMVSSLVAKPRCADANWPLSFAVWTDMRAVFICATPPLVVQPSEAITAKGSVVSHSSESAPTVAARLGAPKIIADSTNHPFMVILW